MLIAISYNNDKNWKLPTFPTVVALVNVFCYNHTMEWFAATKKNEVIMYMQMKRFQELLGGKIWENACFSVKKNLYIVICVIFSFSKNI